MPVKSPNCQSFPYKFPLQGQKVSVFLKVRNGLFLGPRESESFRALLSNSLEPLNAKNGIRTPGLLLG